jgi:hypothetical protein
MVQMKQMRENALPRSTSGRPRGTLSMEARMSGCGARAPLWRTRLDQVFFEALQCRLVSEELRRLIVTSRMSIGSLVMMTHPTGE